MLTMHTDVHKGYLSYKVLIVHHSHVTLPPQYKDGLNLKNYAKCSKTLSPIKRHLLSIPTVELADRKAELIAY